MAKLLLGDRSAPAPIDPSAGDVPVRIVTTASPERFVLIADFAGRCHRFEIDAHAHLAEATAWERTVRRINNVVLCRPEDRWNATATLVGHRLPVIRSISVGTALALGLRGHRISVCSHTLTQSTTGRAAIEAAASATVEGVGHGRLPL